MLSLGLIVAVLALSALCVLLAGLAVTVVVGVARRLGPPRPAPVTALPLDPHQARWTAVDDRQLARFVDDSTA